MIPVLQGPRLTLRGFTWADFPALAAMWQEPEVAKFIPFAPVSPSQNWARFNGNCSAWVRRGFGNWAVIDAAGDFLGTTGFFLRSPTKAAAVIEAGWVFAASGHGKGYATEAAELAHDWLDKQAFGGLSMCKMGPEHGASIRVAEKLGYQVERLETDQWGEVQIMQRIRAE